MNDSTAAVNALAFDKQTGNLRLLNSEHTPGAAPCYVSTNGKEVLTANYSGGNMSVFRLRKDGTLSPAEALFKGTANGPDTIRQIVPHIHCACSHRTGSIYSPPISVLTVFCALH